MFSQAEISKILFLDIETVRGHDTFDELSEGMQKMWKHKSNSIKVENPEQDNPTYKYHDRAGIFAEFGRVCCISFGFAYFQDGVTKLKVKSFFGEDERQILVDFANLLDQKFTDWRLAAHNGKEFDFPYLCRRMMIHQIPLPRLLQVQNKKPWEITHLDTMELWRFGDYKNFTKLELLCQLFGVPTPKDDIDGSQVGHVFWVDKDPERIARYCEKDVVATIQVFLKFCFRDIVPQEHIDTSLAKVEME